MLAVGPWHFFHHYPAYRALYPPHTIYEKNQKSPQRDKFKFPFPESIISRRWPLAAGTYPLRVLPGLYLYMDYLLTCMFSKIRSPVHKTLEFVTLIEDSLYLHLLPFVALRVFPQNYP
jgi:hypothetical protein